MDDKVDAIIRVKVPKWQIGEEVSIYFPDTMMIRGKCETLDESVIQEVLNKRCMTAVTNEYLIALHGKRPQGEQIAWEQGYECGKNERPQINIFCENADEKAIADMKEELQRVIDDLRPQGEWKEHYGSYICSECGQIIGEHKKNYCATCGADMRKGD